MPLPILKVARQPGPVDLMRYFHRTGVHLVQQVAEETQLDVGAAFTNAKFFLKHDANHIRDACLQPGMTPQEAVRIVDGHFIGAGTKCYYWVMNPSAPPAQVEPLAAHLLSIGLVSRQSQIMVLKKAPSLPLREAEGVKVIPARASFRHARELAEQSNRRWGDDAHGQLVEANLQRLDDPHWEVLLVLKDGQAIASVGVLSVGDIGRVEDVDVVEKFRGQGIGRTLMSRALEICARSLFKHVLLDVEPGNAVAISLYEKCGFIKLAELTSYHAL